MSNLPSDDSEYQEESLFQTDPSGPDPNSDPAPGPVLVENLNPSPSAKVKVKTYLRNDSGNADRLKDAYGRDLVYCPETGIMVWTGSSWKQDDMRVERLAEQVLLRSFKELEGLDKDDRNILYNFLNGSLSRKGIGNMVYSVQRKLTKRKLASFNKDPYLLCLRNGVVDLRTSKRREHRREDYNTIVIPYDHDPNATCPIFDAFLFRIMGGKDDNSAEVVSKVVSLTNYVQRVFGCAATGIHEKALFMLRGTADGNNGKTVLLETMRKALGPYAGQITIESLLAKQNDAMGGNNVNAEIADMIGLRFVTASEPAEGQYLNVAKINYLTGGGEQRGRQLREKFFTFTPVHKLFIDCNHRPNIRNPHDAVWNRMKSIPFDVQIDKKDQDPNLKDKKLPLELPGILNWVIKGAEIYLRNGLGSVDAVEADTLDYQATSDKQKMLDALAGFFADRCVFRSKAWTGQTEIWDAYLEFAKAGGASSVLKSVFETALQQRDVKDCRRVHGKVRAWEGVKVLGDMVKKKRVGLVWGCFDLE